MRSPLELSTTTTAFGSWRAKLAVNANVDPAPCSLCRPISPPISSTSCFEMARPRPVPPKRRVVEASACVNASNREPALSGAMPMPVSRTANRSVTASAASETRLTVTAISPCSVNLTALPTRLVSICRSRPGSPRSDAGTSGSTNA